MNKINYKALNIHLFLILLLLFDYSNTLSQTLQIIKYIPEAQINPNTKNQVEIFNNTNQIQDLTGYKIVTRDYFFIFPTNFQIPPGKTVVVSKLPVKNAPLNLLHRQIPDFTIRGNPYLLHQADGCYCALLDPNGELIDGCLVIPQRVTSLLPDVDQNERYTEGPDKKPIKIELPARFSLPAEEHPKWAKLLGMGYDPLIGFQKKDDKWEPVPLQTTDDRWIIFQEFKARYHAIEQLVILKAKVNFRISTKIELYIENSLNGKDFKPFDTLKLNGNRNQDVEFSSYDHQPPNANMIYYRISYKIAEKEYKVSEIFALNPQEKPFWWQVLPTQTPNPSEILIRFYSTYPEEIQLKLLDSDMAEVAILFEHLVEPKTIQLLRLQISLKRGKYWLIARTEDQRYFQQIIIL